MYINPKKFKIWLENNFELLYAPNKTDMRLNCPFCDTTDTNYHMYVNIAKPIYHCFRCDSSGSYEKFLREYLGPLNHNEIFAELRDADLSDFAHENVSVRLESRSSTEKIIPLEFTTFPSWFLFLRDFSPFTDVINDSPYFKRVLKYALKRIEKNDIIKYGLGFSSDISRKYSFRLLIPIEDAYFQARSIGTDKPKYIFPKMRIAHRIFNSYIIENFQQVIICEGIFSAISAGKNAIAVLSNKVNEEQLHRLISSDVKSFIIAFDYDTMYTKTVMKLASSLQIAGKQVIIRHYECGDPDSCDAYSDRPYDNGYIIRSKYSTVRRYSISKSLFH